MFKNILLAVDGSNHALKAARIAGEMARSLGADLWVVTAYDPVPDYLGEPNLTAALRHRLAEADRVLEDARREIGPTPEALKTETLEGPAAEAILAVAGARGNDLIVMGTRGLGRLAGLVLGSQSQKVTAHAVCPVLLVR